MIDPKIWTNRRFIQLNAKERLFYIGLISNADDEGRLWNDFRSLKSKIFPADSISLGRIQSATLKLQEFSLIECDNISIQIKGWLDNQYIKKPQESTIPVPHQDGTSTPPGQPNRIEKNRIEKKGSTVPEPINIPFSQFWDMYAKKVNIHECKKLWEGNKQTKYGNLINNDIRDIIIRHIKVYVERTYKDGSYPTRLNPHSYLFQERWGDELPENKDSDKPGYCPNEECNSYNQDRIMYKETDKCVYCGWELKGRV